MKPQTNHSDQEASEAGRAPAAEVDRSDSAPPDSAPSPSTVIRYHVGRDPYGTIGIAFGLGLLVGGGMWKLIARSVLGLGTRVALGAVVTSLLQPQSPAPHEE